MSGPLEQVGAALEQAWALLSDLEGEATPAHLLARARGLVEQAQEALETVTCEGDCGRTFEGPSL